MNQPAGPEPADVDQREADDRRDRHERLRRDDERNVGDRDGDERRLVGGGRDEAADVLGETDGAGRDGAGKPGDERRPAGEKRGDRSVGVTQVDVLATGARAQRRELGVRHRAGEREDTAKQPEPQHADPARHEAGDEDRHEEDAAADDVRDDDGGRIERTEPPLERGRRSRS